MPSLQPITPAPTASITPAISWPGTIGNGTVGKMPNLAMESLWQTPQACTRMRTSPGFGLGSSRSTSSNGPPFCATWTTRIFGIATSPRVQYGPTWSGDAVAQGCAGRLQLSLTLRGPSPCPARLAIAAICHGCTANVTRPPSGT